MEVSNDIEEKVSNDEIQTNQENMPEKNCDLPTPAEHKLLISAAKRCVMKAKMIANKAKNRAIVLPSNQQDPVDDPLLGDKDKSEESASSPTLVKKIIFAPLDKSKSIKIVSMPQKMKPLKLISDVQAIKVAKPSFSTIPIVVRKGESNSPLVTKNDLKSRILSFNKSITSSSSPTPSPTTSKVSDPQPSTSLEGTKMKVFENSKAFTSYIESLRRTNTTKTNKDEEEETSTSPRPDPLHLKCYTPKDIQELKDKSKPSIVVTQSFTPAEIKRKTISTFRRPNVLRRKQKFQIRSDNDSSNEDDEKKEVGNELNPENFPKAIVYPTNTEKESTAVAVATVEKKEDPPTKPLTFIEAYEESTKRNNVKDESLKTRKGSRMKCRNDSGLWSIEDKNLKVMMPKNRLESEDTIVLSDTETDLDKSNKKIETNKTEVIDESLFEVISDDDDEDEDVDDDDEDEMVVPIPHIPKIKKLKVNYLIPQNLLASETDKAVTVDSENEEKSEDENMDDYMFDAIEEVYPSEHQSQPTAGFSTFPLRPEINCTLIENIAYYRVIAQYLMKKKKISPPINFENVDSNELINIYQSLKR